VFFLPQGTLSPMGRENAVSASHYVANEFQSSILISFFQRNAPIAIGSKVRATPMGQRFCIIDSYRIINSNITCFSENLFNVFSNFQNLSRVLTGLTHFQIDSFSNFQINISKLTH
jgi:hypothetical protein